MIRIYATLKTHFAKDMMPYFFDVALSVQTELMMLILEIQSM